jgi:hypothetical protein
MAIVGMGIQMDGGDEPEHQCIAAASDETYACVRSTEFSTHLKRSALRQMRAIERTNMSVASINVGVLAG